MLKRNIHACFFLAGSLGLYLSCANFLLNSLPKPVTDVDGNVYSVVKIGSQTWTAENLRTTKYNDGNSIKLETDTNNWASSTDSLDKWKSSNEASYSIYNNSTDVDSIKKYGVLYNWHAVKSGKLAPAGWHVSTDEDWKTLINYLIKNGYNYDGTRDSNKIAKSLAAKNTWNSDHDAGTPGNNLSLNNKSGFNALPSGYRYLGPYRERGGYAHFWTTKEIDSINARFYFMGYGIPNVYEIDDYKNTGCVVRLVKDN